MDMNKPYVSDRSPDPTLPLPTELLRSLAEWCLTVDEREANERLDGLLGLLQLADEDLLTDEGVGDLEQGRALLQKGTESGLWELVAAESAEAGAEHFLPPADLLQVLKQHLFDEQADVRRDRLAHVLIVLDEWQGLYVDEEKMLGHLILVHGVPLETLDPLDDSARIAIHSAEVQRALQVEGARNVV